MITPYWLSVYEKFLREVRAPPYPQRNTPPELSRCVNFYNFFWWYAWSIGVKDYIQVAKTPSKKFDMTFVECKLNEKQAKDFQSKYQADSADALREFALLIGTGHKVSCTWDDENVCYIVSAMGREEDHVNFGKCLTARSDDLYEAMALLAYKHNVIYGGKSWVVDKRERSWG